MIQNMEVLIQLFLVSLKKTQVINTLRIVQHHLLIFTKKMTNYHLLMLYNKTMKNHLLVFSNKMWIVERYCKIICHNKVFNLNWLNLLMISSTSTVPRLLRKMNKKAECRQLRNGLFVTWFQFVTYWLWVLLHHIGTWHAKRWKMTERIRKIPISIWMYVFSGLETEQGIQGVSWKILCFNI